MRFQDLSKDDLQNILKFLDFKDGLFFSKINKLTYKVANENLGILKTTPYPGHLEYSYNLYFTNRQYMNVILKMGIQDGLEIETITHILNKWDFKTCLKMISHLKI